MPIPTQFDSTATAIVTVRVPRDSDADLATDAKARLARIDGVSEIRIEGVQGIEPRLSATAVTVAVTIESTVAVADLRSRLANSTSVDAIKRLDGVET